jgi:hypothetical protein
MPDHPDHLFRPIEDTSTVSSGALNWYKLIRTMEEFRRVTGLGLASTWAYVHRGEYHEALADLEAAVKRWERGRSGRRR